MNTEEEFLLFWARYPEEHRGDQPKALRAWQAVVASATDPQAVAKQILTGLDLWRFSEDWLSDNGKWVPFAGAFLSKKKYEQQPKGFAFLRDRRPCTCGRPADDCKKNSDGHGWWCFCRTCQPYIKGLLGTEKPKPNIVRAI